MKTKQILRDFGWMTNHWILSGEILFLFFWSDLAQMLFLSAQDLPKFKFIWACSCFIIFWVISIWTNCRKKERGQFGFAQVYQICLSNLTAVWTLSCHVASSLALWNITTAVLRCGHNSCYEHHVFLRWNIEDDSLRQENCKSPFDSSFLKRQ